MLFSNMYTQLERFEYLDKCDPLLYLLWSTKLFPTRCRDWILKDLEQEGLEWQPCSQKEVFCVKQQWFKWLNHETSLFNYKLTAIVRCPGQRTPLPQTVALDIYHTLENDQEASDNQKVPPLSQNKSKIKGSLRKFKSSIWIDCIKNFCSQSACTFVCWKLESIVAGRSWWKPLHILSSNCCPKRGITWDLMDCKGWLQVFEPK